MSKSRHFNIMFMYIGCPVWPYNTSCCRGLKRLSQRKCLLNIVKRYDVFVRTVKNIPTLQYNSQDSYSKNV